MSLPVRGKSDLSIGCGTAPVEAFVAAAAGAGWRAAWLADLSTLRGQVVFHAACRAQGLRALTGVELRFGDPAADPCPDRRGRVVLLATDRTGWRTLCRVAAARASTGYSVARIDPVEAVPKDASGLVVATDGGATLERLAARVDPARLRLLVVRPGDPEREAGAIETARRLGVRLVADLDVAFLQRDDVVTHRLALAVHRRRRADDPGPTEDARRLLRTPAQVSALFADLPDALAGAEELVDRCDLDLSTTPPVAPAPSLAPGSPDERLASAAAAALAERRARGEALAPAYDARAADEARVVARLGWSAHLLAAVEIATIARERGIATAVRGSAGSSLLLHLLGVSTVDPLAHGLLFERFLSEERGQPPDVDLDVASDRREELIAAAAARFGDDRTAAVSTVVRFQVRSAVREGMTALGRSPEAIAKRLRSLPPADLPDEVAAALGSVGDDAIVARLVGLPRTVALHPGGIVLSAVPLADVVPLERTRAGDLVTQLDVDSLAACGLVKIDLLGSHALAVQYGARAITANSPVVRAEPAGGRTVGRNCSGSVREAIEAGRTIGCFQVESPAVRAVLSRLPLRTLEDVAGALAVVRPGPASGAAKEAYVRRARGEEPEPALPEPLGTVLRPTHGVLLYEEQAIEALAAACDVPLGRADALRRAIAGAHADPAALAAVRDEVEALARGRLGLQDARALFELLAAFSTYAFSKAHALSYAAQALDAVSLSVAHPACYAAATLDHPGGTYPPRVVVAELARRGVRFAPPSVVAGGARSTVERDSEGPLVRVGLAKVKALRARSLAAVLRAREEAPFRDLADLLARVPLAAAEAASLVRAGALDGLDPLSGDAHPFAHETVTAALDRGERPPLEVPASPVPSAASRRLSTLVRIRDETRALGFFVTAHPMAVLRPEADRMGCVPSTALPTHVGAEVRFAGIVSAARNLRTASGELLRLTTFEDEHGVVEGVVRPALTPRASSPASPGPWLLVARVASVSPLRLEVRSAAPFHERKEAWVSP